MKPPNASGDDPLSRGPAHRLAQIDRLRLLALWQTALWATARDQRFSFVLTNKSSQAGVTLSHRQRGSVEHMMVAFPYWFCGNCQHYLGRTQSLPVDGHLPLASSPPGLCMSEAPSPTCFPTRGRVLGRKAVTTVHTLYGKQGLPGQPLPPLSHSIGDTVGYQIRPGGHDVTASD